MAENFKNYIKILKRCYRDGSATKRIYCSSKDLSSDSGIVWDSNFGSSDAFSWFLRALDMQEDVCMYAPNKISKQELEEGDVGKAERRKREEKGDAYNLINMYKSAGNIHNEDSIHFHRFLLCYCATVWV